MIIGKSHLHRRTDVLQSATTGVSLTRQLLRLLILMNILWGIAILSLLVATLIAPGPVLSALGAHPAAGNDQRILGMRMIMVLGIASVPLIHAALARLGAMVETVQLGDPFVHENAVRLARIAWVVLALELLHLAVGAVVAAVSSPTAPLRIGWSLSPTPWLAVLLLFVLARVFERGTAMREELEAVV
jgi:Protein of unknown function (DUF2975)